MPTKVCIVKAMVFPVAMYGCKSWTIKKNEHQRIDIFELWCWRRLLRVSWTARRSNQYPKGNQSWIFIGRTDAEVEAPIFWPLDMKSWLFGKDPDTGKDWRPEEKGTTEDETVGSHHRFNRYEFEQTLGDSEGQGNLVCCSQWGCKESERLSDWTTTTTRIITGMKFLPRFEQCQKYPLQMVSSSNTFFLKERTHTREEMKTRTLADGSWEAWEEETRILVLFWLQGPWGSQNPSFYSVSSSAWCPRTLMTPRATSVPVMYLFWSSELTGLSPYNPL